jgi:hypothetical protein
MNVRSADSPLSVSGWKHFRHRNIFVIEIFSSSKYFRYIEIFLLYRYFFAKSKHFEQNKDFTWQNFQSEIHDCHLLRAISPKTNSISTSRFQDTTTRTAAITYEYREATAEKIINENEVMK